MPNCINLLHVAFFLQTKPLHNSIRVLPSALEELISTSGEDGAEFRVDAEPLGTLSRLPLGADTIAAELLPASLSSIARAFAAATLSFVAGILERCLVQILTVHLGQTIEN